MATYSFKNYKATFFAPGSGSFSIGSDVGIAADGISFAMIEDKDTMDVGAGGEIMHNLNAADAGRVTVRVLKTSRVNSLLNAAYNFQKEPQLVGQNIIRGADTERGDVQDCTELAFVKQPDLQYAKAGGIVEWQFQGKIFEKLGVGTPTL